MAYFTVPSDGIKYLKGLHGLLLCLRKNKCVSVFTQGKMHVSEG